MSKPVTSKAKLLSLLERNPPELFTALASVINDGNFNDKAKNTASDVDYLIEKIKKMDVYEINALYCSVQRFLS